MELSNIHEKDATTTVYSCVAATARPRRDIQRAACWRRAYSQLS